MQRRKTGNANAKRVRCSAGAGVDAGCLGSACPPSPPLDHITYHTSDREGALAVAARQPSISCLWLTSPTRKGLWAAPAARTCKPMQAHAWLWHYGDDPANQCWSKWGGPTTDSDLVSSMFQQSFVFGGLDVLISRHSSRAASLDQRAAPTEARIVARCFKRISIAQTATKSLSVPLTGDPPALSPSPSPADQLDNGVAAAGERHARPRLGPTLVKYQGGVSVPASQSLVRGSKLRLIAVLPTAASLPGVMLCFRPSCHPHHGLFWRTAD